MLEVQTAQLDSHQGPGTPGNALPGRLLEDSDGVVRLYDCDEVVATCHGKVQLEQHSHPKAIWLQWSIERLVWQRAPAFKLLQGGTLQQLVGIRYTIIHGRSTPAYDPVPAVKDLVLAELLSAEAQLPRRQFFEFIHSLKLPGQPRG
jgi:hypothetical protein